MNFDILKGKFSKIEAKQLNPLVLAYIGDAVFEVFVRSCLVDKNRQLLANKLHRAAIKHVSAKAQSDFLRKIQPLLTEEELQIFKRGRNAKASSSPKNASIQDYRVATGFEALIGYLYLMEDFERMNNLLEKLLNDNKEEQTWF